MEAKRQLGCWRLKTRFRRDVKIIVRQPYLYRSTKSQNRNFSLIEKVPERRDVVSTETERNKWKEHAKQLRAMNCRAMNLHWLP